MDQRPRCSAAWRRRSSSGTWCGLAVVILVAFGSTSTLAAAPAAVHEIRIQSRQLRGTTVPLRTTLAITPHGASFRVTGTTNSSGQPEPIKGNVDASAVKRLLQALQAPAQAKVIPAQLGANQAWIQQMIASTSGNFDDVLLKSCLAGLQARDNSDALAQVMQSGFGVEHTDDYPVMSVTVEMDDGTTLAASSNSQPLQMLPWTLPDGARTYNPAIPTALHSLLPSGTANRSRLAAPTAEQLGQLVARGLWASSERTRVEMLAAGALNTLRARFHVVDARLPPVQGVPSPSSRPDDSKMSVRLAMLDGPPNLSLTAHFSVWHGQLRADKPKLDRIAWQFQRLRQTPVIWQRIQDNPDIEFSVHYSGGDSNRTYLAAAWRKLDIQRPAAVLADALIVDERQIPDSNGIDWIVLADHRVIRETSMTSESATPLDGTDQLCDPNDTADNRCFFTAFDAHGRALP